MRDPREGETLEQYVESQMSDPDWRQCFPYTNARAAAIQSRFGADAEHSAALSLAGMSTAISSEAEPEAPEEAEPEKATEAADDETDTTD